MAPAPQPLAAATLRTARQGSLVSVLDLDRARILALLGHARDLRRAKAIGRGRAQLSGRNLALVLGRGDARGRTAFEIAAADEGAHVIPVPVQRQGLGADESVADTARTLGRLVDGIALYGCTQAEVEEFAVHAGVPVWNGGTEAWLPVQVLADLLALSEHRSGPWESISCAFVGDATGAVACSLLVAGAAVGMDVRIAAPPTLRPPDDVLALARDLAAAGGTRLLVTDDPLVAVAGADAVLTDAWVRADQTVQQWALRVPYLQPYRVTEALLAHSGVPHTMFLHGLPAVHDRGSTLGRRFHEEFDLDGAEVTDAVFASARSIVLDQAESRLHAVKAVMVAALGP